MSPLVAYRLAAVFLLLIVACLIALPLLRAHQRRRRLEERVAQHSAPYARATFAGSGRRSNVTAVASGGRRLLLKLLWEITAYDPEQREQHLLPWWVVFPISLPIARVIGGFGQSLVGRPALLAIPVVWILLIRRFYRWCEQRRLAALFDQFPDALAILVRAVRIGIPISEGIRNVAADSPKPTGHEFSLVVDQLALGVTLEEALRHMAARNPISEYGFFATALALQSETGGAISDTLERLADVIRKRVAMREHARALAAEARTSIAILAALPVFTGLALAAINPDYIATLFNDPQGRRIFASAVISLSTGILTMRLIVSRSLA
jgi:tight adherence protein B